MDKKVLAYLGVGAVLLYFVLKPKTAKAEGRSEVDPLPVGPAAPPTTPAATSIPAEVLPPPPPFDDLPPPPPIDAISPSSIPTSSGAPSYQTRVIKRGDSWGGLAKEILKDYRWWPFIWDFNRVANPTDFTNPDSMKLGLTIFVPRGTEDVLSNEKYKKAVFARAQAHADWWRNKMAGGRARPFPKSVYVITDPRTV